MGAVLDDGGIPESATQGSVQTQKGTPKMTDRQLADLKLIIELIEYMIQSQTIQMRQNIHDAYMRLAKDVAEAD